MDEDLIDDQNSNPDSNAQQQDDSPAGGDDASQNGIASFLDALTTTPGQNTSEAADDGQGNDDPNDPANAGRPRDEHGRFLPKTVAPAQTDPNAVPGGGVPPATGKPTGVVPPAPANEEEELLAGVKSERGRARLQEVFAERRQATEQLTAVREMVRSSGMDVEAFASTMEWGRLARSSDPKDLQQALAMLDEQRAGLALRLGVDVPGVDPLQDFPDLSDAVQNLAIDRTHALEIAKHRRSVQAGDQQRQVEQQRQDENQQYQVTVQQGQQQMAQYLQSREKEIDHPARMKVITQYFQNPAKMQEFVKTYEPKQWAHALRLMYDNIQPAAAPRRSGPAPISSRPGAVGRPAPGANLSPEERTANVLDSMGL